MKINKSAFIAILGSLGGRDAAVIPQSPKGIGGVCIRPQVCANSKLIKSAWMLILLAALSLTACSSAFTGEGAGQGTVSISLFGSDARAVGLPFPPTEHSDIMSELVLRIKMDGPTRAQTHTLDKGVTSARFSVAAGLWRISVEALHEGDLYATGSGEVNVKAGQSNQCTIQMSQTIYTYTVTFTDGYGTTLKTETVSHGGNATAPANPTVTGKYNSKFVAWDRAFTNITAATTVNATWTNYAVGETGPGGGTIFYVAPDTVNGFPVVKADGSGNDTAYYLEAASADLSGYAWASLSNLPSSVGGTGDYLDIPGTELGIGTGRKNTALILALDSDAPAAKACDEYSTATASDWFLPSRDELQWLYTNRALVGMGDTGTYWSSTQGAYGTARVWNFAEDKDNYVDNKSRTTYQTRPVRAF